MAAQLGGQVSGQAGQLGRDRWDFDHLSSALKPDTPLKGRKQRSNALVPALRDIETRKRPRRLRAAVVARWPAFKTHTWPVRPVHPRAVDTGS